MNVIAQENGGVVLTKRRTDANQTHHGARITGFFVKLSQRSGFGTFPRVDVSFWETPFSLVGPRGLLDEKDFAVLNDPRSDAKVTKERGHERDFIDRVYQGRFRPL